jgi:hypothetical protein
MKLKHAELAADKAPQARFGAVSRDATRTRSPARSAWRSAYSNQAK